nr:hypothetical protein [Stenotrophomonas maltophilia]
MNKAVLQFHDLQELCQPGKKPRLASVIRRADGSGEIWTTMDVLNEALGLIGATPHLEPYTD